MAALKKPKGRKKTEAGGRLGTWNPTTPTQWPPLWVSDFPGLAKTGSAFAVLWLVFALPFALLLNGAEGLKVVVPSAPIVGCCVYFYEWRVPIVEWRRRLASPTQVLSAIAGAGLTLIASAPVAFTFFGDWGLQLIGFWAFLVGTSILLGFKPWRLVVLSVQFAAFAILMGIYQTAVSAARPASPNELGSFAHLLKLAALLFGALGIAQGLEEAFDMIMGTTPKERVPMGPAGCAGILFVVIGIPLSGAALFVSSGFAARTIGSSLLASFLVYPVAYRISRSLGLLLAGLTFLNTDILFLVLGYLRQRALAVLGFVSGYVLITFWFATAFYILWRGDSGSLHGISAAPSFADFWYFSVITLATVGYGDITPATSPARILVGVEVLVGVLWTTVVVTGIVGISNATVVDPKRKADR